MKSFKDNAGRTWTLSIHVAAVKRCRALLGLDLYGLLDDRMKGLGDLLGDPVRLVDALYVLCKDEADRAGVTDEQFGAALAGDALGAAADAFVGELADFFPDPLVREGLRAFLAKCRQTTEKLNGRLATLLAAIDPDDVARRLIASSGSSRASSASTRRRSPSANST